MVRIRSAALAFCASATLCAAVGAQTPAEAPLGYEVASVKANRSGSGRVGFGNPPGQFTATNVPLRFLIQQAYRFMEFQVVGGPSWMDSERFDITAKTPRGAADGTPGGGVSPEANAAMLRALLADRFKLVAHIDTREMPVYVVTVAKGDGTLGPNLRASTVDCAARGRARGAAPPQMPQPGQPIECGMMMGFGPNGSTIRAGGSAFGELLRTITQNLGRKVIDKTGLTGNFDIELQFVGDRPGMAGMPPLPPTAAGPSDPSATSNLPSLVTALREQAGLKLESERGPVEILVIDSVERPTED
jgi:uncharacterized protein (TIGR03435 family)